jgi:3-oxoacyl-[acyl-carrier-protein] synthase III
VLLIGAEILTRLTNYDDRKIAALSGDGAGAVVLGHDGEGAVGPVVLIADGGLALTKTAARIPDAHQHTDGRSKRHT